MENTEAIWQQRLAKRREGTPWKVIIEAEGFKYGGTFTGHLKIARDRGWIPSEATLPPAIRSDGKRQGLLIPTQKATMTDETPVEVLPNQMDLDADTAADPMSVSTGVDIVSEPLSPAEVQSLEHYEQIIAQGIKTFVEVGHALLVIRDERLYRERHETFEDYLRQRWDLVKALRLPTDGRLRRGGTFVANWRHCSRERGPSPTARQLVTRAATGGLAGNRRHGASGMTAKHVQETVKRVKATGTTLTDSADVEGAEALRCADDHHEDQRALHGLVEAL